MSKSHGPQITLDGRFQLDALIRAGENSALFLAQHGSGETVFVKLVWAPGEFFDELARIYASDGMPWFCRCLYHYAPAVATGQTVPLNPLPGDVYDSLRGIEQDNLGVLIMEPVAGTPLETWCRRADDLAKIDPLMDLSEAMEALHELGESYGDINPDRIWIESDTEEIRILDLGPGPSENGPFDPSGDVKAFGKLGLKVMQRPNRRLKRSLGKKSNHGSLGEIRTELRQFRKRIQPKKSLELWLGFLRPLHVSLWVLTAFAVSMMLSQLQGEPQALERARERVMERTHRPAAEREAALREILAKTDDAPFRAQVIENIGQIQAEQGVEHFMPLEDLRRPIAVLDFGRQPAMIGREQIFRLGDRVRTDELRGIVQEIKYNRILVRHQTGDTWLPFQRPEFNTARLMREQNALVWSNDHNLPRLVEALAQLSNKQFINLNRTEGKLAGSFSADSVETLLHKLSNIVDLRIDNTTVTLAAYTSDIPVYMRLHNVSFKNKHIDEFTDWLNWAIGYPVEYDPSLANRHFDIRAFDTSWRELIGSMGLSYDVIVDSSGQKVLRLKEGTPQDAPSLN